MTKSEVTNTFSEVFHFLKCELQAVKTEINSTAALSSEIDQVKASIKDLEGGLSMQSDEVATLHYTVSSLKVEVAPLKKEMQGHRRKNDGM